MVSPEENHIPHFVFCTRLGSKKPAVEKNCLLSSQGKDGDSLCGRQNSKFLPLVIQPNTKSRYCYEGDCRYNQSSKSVDIKVTKIITEPGNHLKAEFTPAGSKSPRSERQRGVESLLA